VNLTYFRPKMRGNVEKNNPVNIRFVTKTPDIRNLFANITSDAMLKYQKWQHWHQWSRTSGAVSSRTASLFHHKGKRVVKTHFSSDGYYRCVTS